MARYIKKPVEIDADQWNPDDPQCVENMKLISSIRVKGRYLFIDTLEGSMQAESGDWIIRGVKGEYYPCKPDIFEMTYEPLPTLPDQCPEQKPTHCPECNSTWIKNPYGNTWECFERHCNNKWQCNGTGTLPKREG